MERRNRALPRLAQRARTRLQLRTRDHLDRRGTAQYGRVAGVRADDDHSVDFRLRFVRRLLCRCSTNSRVPQRDDQYSGQQSRRAIGDQAPARDAMPAMRLNSDFSTFPYPLFGRSSTKW